MSWLSSKSRPKIKTSIDSQIEVPDNVWKKCKECEAILYHKEIKDNMYICPKCNYHMTMPTEARLKSMFDEGKYEKIVLPKVEEDPIKFEDLTDEQIASYLNLHDKELIKLCDGSLEKASKIQENKEIYMQLKQLANTLETGSLIDCLNFSKMLTSLKDNILEILDYLNIIFFEKCKSNINCAKAISTIEKTKKKIIANNNFDMSIDYMLIHIWEELHGKSSRS